MQFLAPNHTAIKRQGQAGIQAANLRAQELLCGLWAWNVPLGSHPPASAAHTGLGTPRPACARRGSPQAQAGPGTGRRTCDHEHVCLPGTLFSGYDHQKLTEKLKSRART